MLQSTEFRDRVKMFLSQNVRASIPGVGSPSELMQLETKTDVAYSRPANPSSLLYDEDVEALERVVVRTKQLHKCTLASCLKLNSTGVLTCKRRAPWPLSDENVVGTDGSVILQRYVPYLNGFCPAITHTLRCNNDIRALLNGELTRGITFYLSLYMTKKQGRSYNSSALWANQLAYHFNRTNYNVELQERQKMLLFRAMNAITREQELAAPLVMLYLMGWGDTYRSHRYVPLYTSGIYWAVVETWPELGR